jgi:hypothetical protein
MVVTAPKKLNIQQQQCFQKPRRASSQKLSGEKIKTGCTDMHVIDESKEIAGIADVIPD